MVLEYFSTEDWIFVESDEDWAAVKKLWRRGLLEIAYGYGSYYSLYARKPREE